MRQLLRALGRLCRGCLHIYVAMLCAYTFFIGQPIDLNLALFVCLSWSALEAVGFMAERLVTARAAQ